MEEIDFGPLGNKEINKRMWATWKAEGQAEEMDATAGTANTLESTAGVTAIPAKTRKKFFTVLLLAPDPKVVWVLLIDCEYT